MGTYLWMKTLIWGNKLLKKLQCTFKLIEGCFGDGFEMTAEGQIWVYQHTKVSDLVPLLFIAKNNYLSFVLI